MLAPLADSLPAVRFADRGDEDALVAMVTRMHADPEWGLRDWDGSPFKADEEKVRAVIQRATVLNRNAPDAGCWIGVVVVGGQLIGSVCLHFQEPMLSRGEYLEMVWPIWVAPEHRRTPASQLLLNFSIALADQHQRTLVSADRAYENGGRARFMQRRIGRPVGSVFAYNSAAGTV